MKLIAGLLFIIFVTAHTQSLAHTAEEGKVTATLGPYINRTLFLGPYAKDLESYLGSYALIAVGDISPRGGLEIAMIYSPNILFYRESAGKYIAERVQSIHITMGYHWWLTSRFSTSLAFYSAYSIGTPNIVYSEFSPANLVDTSARDVVEYGFDGAAQWELWSHQGLAAIIEGRYSASVTHKKDENSDNIGILIGLRYVVQEEKAIETRKP